MVCKMIPNLKLKHAVYGLYQSADQIFNLWCALDRGELPDEPEQKNLLCMITLCSGIGDQANNVLKEIK